VTLSNRDSWMFEEGKRHTRAALSLLLVMQYVQSLLICKSVTTSLCARSLLSISSPVLTLKSATLPDSCPVMITFGVNVNAQTVAFEPTGLNMNSGSFDSVTRKMVLNKRTEERRKKGCTFCAFPFRVDPKHPNRTLVSHPLFCYANHLRSFLVECHPLHGRRELPGV